MRFFTTVFLLGFAAMASSAAEPRKPNILVI